MCIRYRNINVFWLALVPSTIRTALMMGDMLGTTPLSFQRNSYVWRFYVWCRIADLVDIVRAYTGDNNLKCIYFEPKPNCIGSNRLHDSLVLWILRQKSPSQQCTIFSSILSFVVEDFRCLHTDCSE